MEEFDVVIIGGGQAGIPLAVKLVDSKQRVLLCERKLLGGSCVNFGCTPTKAALASAKVAHLARRAAEYGLVVPSVGVDFSAVIHRSRAIAEYSRTKVASYLSENGVEVRGSHARLVGHGNPGFLISVEEKTILARSVVINTGARTRVPEEIEGLSQVPYLHAGNWLQSVHLPRHVAFVGAGFIALEMAQFYRRMGAEVTVVGQREIIAHGEDADVALTIQTELEKEGIAFHLRSRVSFANLVDREVRMLVDRDGQSFSLVASHLFLATGRLPNTDDLGLETVNLVPDKSGGIPTDDRLASTIPGIWVAGDARGREMFTHSSWDDHRILESQLLGDGSRTTRDRIIPYALFTDPELGRVGLTETEARRKLGDNLAVTRFAMERNGRAVEDGESEGMIKLLSDKRDGTLVGAAVLAAHGSEIAASYVTLMNAGGHLSHIQNAIYAHPTLSEAMQSAVSSFVFEPTNSSSGESAKKRTRTIK